MAQTRECCLNPLVSLSLTNQPQSLAILLICLTVTTVGVRLSFAEYRTDATIAAGAIDIVSAMCIIAVIYVEHFRGIRASALLSLYITICVIIDGIQTRSYFIRHIPSLGGLAATSTSLRFVLLCAMEASKREFIIDPELRDFSSGEATSGYWGRTFFGFMAPIFRAGLRKVLSLDDLGNLGVEFSSANLFASLSQRWGVAKQRKAHSLFLACLRTWWRPLLAIAIPRLCVTGFNFAQPFVMRRMVLSHREELSGSVKAGLIGATFLSYGGSAIAKAISMQMKYRFVTRTRGGLVSQVADKTNRLKLSQARRQAAVTLVSTDLDGIVTGFPSLIEIPFSVLETGIGMYFLTEFVHKASFIVFLPLGAATILGIIYGKFQSPALQYWNQVIESRVAKTSRMLGQLPAIKMLGLGPKMAEFLQYLRISEIRASRKFRLIQGLAISTTGFLDMCTPVAVIAGAVFWKLFGEKLSAEVIFPALGLIALIQSPIQNLLKSYPLAMSMLGCFSRIQAYLCQEEHIDPRVLLSLTPREVTRAWPTPGGNRVFEARTVRRDPSRIIRFDNVSLSPIGMDGVLLQGLSLSIAPGTVSALFGTTGAGKTSLVNTILGETEVTNGIVYVDDDAIAICGQDTWLPNMTVTETVVAGLDHDPIWLHTVLEVFRLLEDIAEFEDGQDHMIGSGGVNISGGQRQRLSMARAVYARTRTIVLDDSFSSLDRLTARAILNDLCNKQNGLLRASGCTVIMTSYLPECMTVADNILYLTEDGELIQRASQYMDADLESEILNMLYQEHNIEVIDAPAQPRRRQQQPESESESEEFSSDQDMFQTTPLHANPTAPRQTSPLQDPSRYNLGRRTGDSRLYWLWIDQIGRCLLLGWFVIVLIMCIAEGFPTIYMRWWIEKRPANKVYFVGYALLAATAGLMGGPCVVIMMLKLAPRASIGLHGKLTDVVVRATLGYLGSNEAANLLNRYSVDMDLIAKHIPVGVYNNLYFGITTMIQVGIALSGADYMAAVLPILFALVYVTQRCYLFTSRQLRHLEIENQGPLATALRETAEGLIYVRSYGWQAATLRRALHLLDQSQKPFYLLLCAQQALSFVLDLMSSLMATFLAVLTLCVKDASTENSSGLSFLVLIILGGSLNRTIVTWTLLETALGSLSRFMSFFDLTPVEKEENTRPAPPNWPSRGQIEISNVTARYQVRVDETQQPPPTLHGVSLYVEPGKKIGIMGRTGSGKSSLLKAMLGFLSYSGSIYIDGIDIRTVPLDQLRSRIITISQDQVELEGTIRDNLLPYEKTWSVEEDEKNKRRRERQARGLPEEEVNSEVLTDEEKREEELARQLAQESAERKDRILRETLVHLRIWDQLVLKGGLDTPLSEAGFSHGEMQLLCIARAVVRRRVYGGRLVLIDEATGGVDRWRDQIVREMIRDYFRGCTILIVAHRSDSIADSQSVVKMGRGRVISRDDYE